VVPGIFRQVDIRVTLGILELLGIGAVFFTIQPSFTPAQQC
jgi:hypothetical protein